MAGFGFKPLKAGGGSGYAIVSKKGKPHWLKLGRYNTLGDAKRAHKRWEREGHETMQSFPCTSDSPTLAQYTPRYLERTIGKNLTGEGIDRARSSLKHLNRLLGHMKLHRIDPNAVEDYIIKRKNELNPRNGKPFAPKTINIEVTQLSSVIVEAVMNGIISTHPFKTQQRRLKSYFLRTTRRIPVILSEEEIFALKEEMAKNMHSLSVFLTLIMGGMRKGELEGLRWENVDIPGKKITFDSKKTDDYRTIFISDSLVLLFEHMKTNWPDPVGKRGWVPRKPSQMKYVFCDREGKQYSRNFGDFLGDTARRLGIPKKVTPHVLRHSFAAFGREHLTIFQLSKMLGHKNITTTENYGYTLDIGMKSKINDIAETMGLSGDNGFTPTTQYIPLSTKQPIPATISLPPAVIPAPTSSDKFLESASGYLKPLYSTANNPPFHAKGQKRGSVRGFKRNWNQGEGNNRKNIESTGVPEGAFRNSLENSFYNIIRRIITGDFIGSPTGNRNQAGSFEPLGAKRNSGGVVDIRAVWLYPCHRKALSPPANMGSLSCF